jgi:hypothetical protein
MVVGGGYGIFRKGIVRMFLLLLLHVGSYTPRPLGAVRCNVCLPACADCCWLGAVVLLLLLQVADLQDAVAWLTNSSHAASRNTPRDLPAGVLDPKVGRRAGMV